MSQCARCRAWKLQIVFGVIRGHYLTCQALGAVRASSCTLLSSPISLFTWKTQNYVSSRTFFHGAHAVPVWLGDRNLSLEGRQSRENPPATFCKNGCPMNTGRGMSQAIGAVVVCHLTFWSDLSP